MSDETTLEVNDIEQPQAAPVIPTSEDLQTLTRNRDIEGLKAAVNQIENPDKVIVPPTDDSATNTQIQDQPPELNNDSQITETVPPADTPAKTFRIKFRGKDVEREDPDKLFGYGSLGKMKKAFLHKEQELQYRDQQEKEARALINKQTIENEQLKRDLEAARKNAQAVPPTPQNSITPEPTVQLPEMPEAPVPPVPNEYGEIDQAALATYITENADYQNKVLSYVKASQSIQTQPGSIANDPVVVELRKKIELYETAQKQQEEQAVIEERKKARNNYWKEKQSFWEKNSAMIGEMPPIEDMSAYNQSIIDWTDKLAESFGYQKPLTPYNKVDPNWQTYEAALGKYVRDFLDGDPDTIATATSHGAVPPKGYEGFYNIVDIMNHRKSLIDKGVFAEGATLENAFNDYVGKHKLLESSVNEVETAATTNGVNSIIDTMQNRQQNTATTIPNNMQEITPTEISSEEVLRIMKMNGRQLAADPVAAAKKRELLAAGNVSML
jgi:hypothetical protein